MEKIVYFLGFLSLGFAFDFEESLGHIKATAGAKVQEDAAENLIKRIIPEYSQHFVVKINNDNSKDYFKLESLSDGKIKITGTTGVTIATGFNYYLKYFCKSQISWETTQLNLPEILPDINVTITLNDKFRYYQNVCTPGYSFTWWNWKQWEKHIDWMALNSFNLVLAFNGQEAIWERVYQKLNLTGKEIREHFSGPAFLPWNRMGNIRGWGGPLSPSWHSRSLILQKNILKRMRELGIIPVLPAFAGQVPRAFKRIFPEAKLHPLQTWNRFNDTYCCPYLLEPNEPLFKVIGKMFMEEMISEFGTDHIYNCDTFNEMIPSSSSEEYLRSIGQSVYNAMIEVDEKAIWLMQGWLFHHDSDFWTYQAAKSLLENVPLGKMILLDLQSEQFPQYGRLDSYFGQPFIFCMLHNFGGTLGMYGSVDIINNRVFEARSMNGSTMIGTGLTPEGINQNYVIYDLMVEMAWRKTPVDLTNWFNSYAERRYGFDNINAQNAWEILKNTTYNFKGLEKIRGKFAYNKTPRTNIKTWTWYNHCELLDAWDYLLAASDELGNSTGYLHDLVDLTRQVLQNFGDEFYNEMIQGFKEKNINRFQESADIFKEIFTDVEKILASNEAFLLGNWLNDAKNCADNEEDRKLFEYNARNQITLWGPNGEIMDYANKQWSGMVSHFFEPRWSLFIRSMNDSLISQRPFKESQVTKNIFKTVEEPFTFDRTSFPDQPIGDTVEIANEIYKKWRNRGHCIVERSRVYGDEFFNTQRPRVVLVN